MNEESVYFYAPSPPSTAAMCRQAPKAVSAETVALLSSQFGRVSAAPLAPHADTACKNDNVN